MRQHDPEARCMEVYEAIIEYKRTHDGNSPGLRELVELTSYASTSTVSYALGKLEEQGLIKRGRHYQSRKIEVVGARWISPEEKKYCLIPGEKNQLMVPWEDAWTTVRTE